MRTLLIGFALVTAAVVGGVILIVRSALAPLRDIGDRVAQIDARQLHLRLPAQSLPAELAPIHARLNELLARLDQAFARERRFTSDVAHELRTPIAELRSVTEVALRWPGDVKSATDALLESHDIARQMQTLVTTLLALVRSDRMPAAELSSVSLLDSVQKTLASLHADRDATVDVRISAEASIHAEPTLLASILRNVMENALAYRDIDQPVMCEATLQSDHCVLSVRNHASRLDPEDMQRVFEPFWRKDAARTDPNHSGLGLALVRSYCALIKAQVQATLHDGIFCVELSFLREVNHAEKDVGADLVGSSLGGRHGASR
jgi:two-component system sensor histidine kinase QseC